MNTAKVSQAETSYTTKQRRNRVWLTRLALLIVLGFVFYFGYCWGLWGRKSLLLQYLFQCGCPAASAEARYPEEVDVVVPACRYVSSILSPSGRLLYIQEKNGSSNSTYLLYLQTNEKTSFLIPDGSNHFLTDNLIFHSFYGNDEYVLDISTGMKYPVQNAAHIQPNIYSMGDIEPKLLLEALAKVDHIFLIDEVFQPVIAISQNARSQPEVIFTFNVLDFPGDESSRVKQFLDESNIVYNFVPASFPREVTSPNGKFIAREDGIYLANTNQKIVEGYSSSSYYRIYSGKYYSVRGWTYDSSGAIYSKFLEPCLLETRFFILDSPACFVQVPQPLLKLKVPDEYLLSALTP